MQQGTAAHPGSASQTDRKRHVRCARSLTGPPLAVHLHRELAVHVVSIEEATEAVRILGALLRDVLAREEEPDIAWCVASVLVPDAGRVERCDAVHSQIHRPACLPGRGIVETAAVVAEVLR